MTPVPFETVAVRAGAAPLWPLHRHRAAASAAVLGLRPPPLEEPSWPEGDAAVRCELHDGAWLLAPREATPTTSLVLATSPAPHRGYRHKVTDRAWLEAARLSVAPLRADDALLLTEGGEVVEASRWAIGWWEGEGLVFPDLALGGLPSVARAHLGALVRGRLRAATVARDALRGRSLVACNAARGLVPVAVLDGEAVPGNLRTAALAARFWRAPLA